MMAFFVWPLLSPCYRSLTDSTHQHCVLRSKHQCIRGMLCALSPTITWWMFALSAGHVSTAARSASTQFCEDVFISRRCFEAESPPPPRDSNDMNLDVPSSSTPRYLRTLSLHYSTLFSLSHPDHVIST